MNYQEEDFLLLSGLQHFVFCRRQWALIHVEGQWAENLHTVEGHIIHNRVHNENIKDSRGDIKVVRGLKVKSHELGIAGVCDAVEFHRNNQGVFISKFNNKYRLFPVEYKKGKPKNSKEDIVQLVAQAMCLEEMLATKINYGYLFYYQIRRRQKIIISDELRLEVKKISQEMHQLFDQKRTPKVKINKKCNSCSLKDICLPKINKNKSVKKYLERLLENEEIA